MRTAVGVDLGGTNVRVALVNEAGEILDSLRKSTPVSEGPEATAQLMGSLIKDVTERFKSHNILGVGIGSPGPLSRKEKKIFQTPNLPGFDGFPLGKKVEEITKFPVLLDNDAKCACFGEGLFGVAKNVSDYILLTFGTGIGGGVVVNGQMLYGKTDGACEIGHMTLYPNGKLCKCGNRGCFEQYCSASAIKDRATLCAGREVRTIEVFEALLKNEAWATQVLREVAIDLAMATASLVNIFDPRMIVFGGGVFTAGGGPLCEWVREEIKNRCFKSLQNDLQILPSSLSGNAGVLGAAAIVFRNNS
jgi:glucokinase